MTTPIVQAGAALVANGLTLTAAAEALGTAGKELIEFQQTDPTGWASELHQARKRSANGPQPNQSKKPIPSTPLEQALQTIKRTAALVAAGDTIKAAAEKLDIESKKLYRLTERWKTDWKSELEVARAQLRAIGCETPVAAPCKRIRNGIRKATALAAAGLDHPEIAAALNVPATTIHSWQTDYHELWNLEYDRAMEAVLLLIRSQAGTNQVFNDPADYIRRARLCERWARNNDREIFPQTEVTTLSSFFETHYISMRLGDASKETIKTYRDTIKLWCLVTGNPPLKEINTALLGTFKSIVQKLPGLKKGTAISVNTVRKHLRNLQVLLDKAGPPGFKNRDAAGIIPGPVAWIKPPRAEEKTPRFVQHEHISDVYKAAVCMDQPRIEGVKPPSWWRTLIVTAFNTQLRRRSLFELLWDEVDFENHILDLPPKRLKSRRRQIVHLNEVTIAHLKKIRIFRVPRELVFPWPYAQGWFDKCFHRLQAEAGIPRRDYFGLHDLRRTAATILWEDSPQAAQYALGHSSMNTTRDFYVNGQSIVARALDALPQPEAFSG